MKVNVYDPFVEKHIIESLFNWFSVFEDIEFKDKNIRLYIYTYAVKQL